MVGALGGELDPGALLLVNLSAGAEDVDIAARWFGHLDAEAARCTRVSVAFEKAAAGGRATWSAICPPVPVASPGAAVAMVVMPRSASYSNRSWTARSVRRPPSAR